MRAILPEDVDWKPFPPFPPSVRLAVLGLEYVDPKDDPRGGAHAGPG